VAILNDVLALEQRNALPSLLTPTSSRHITFLHWRALIWIAWALAFVVLAHKAWQWRVAARAAAAGAGAPVATGATGATGDRPAPAGRPHPDA
jgi:hypothetical protein